jgi:hypothetical protein
MQQRHKEPRPKRAIMSGKQENTHKDLQADCRAGDHEANRITVRLWKISVRSVEGSAPSETREKTTHRVGAGEVGALTTLGTFVLTDR